jgi:hypothetical protein
MEGAAEATEAAAETRAHAVSARAEEDEPRPPVVRAGALVEEATRAATTLNDKLPTLSQESPVSGNHKVAPAEREPRQAREDGRGDGGAAHASPQPFGREEELVAESGAAETTQAAQGEPRGRIGRRAAAVGASVGESVRPRVEKLREASTVVFDEATDDPGLRFVIVAAVLFLVFLFIFLFSYILG